MRILLVTDERGSPTTTGGAMGYLLSIMKPAIKLGHDVNFITGDAFRGRDTKPEKLSEYLHSSIDKSNPDIVVVFNNCIWGLGIFDELDSLGIPSVLNVPDYALLCKNRMLLKRERDMCSGDNKNCSECKNYRVGIPDNIDTVKSMRGRKIVVGSNFLRDQHIRVGFEPENIEMVEIGIDPSAYTPSYGGTTNKMLNVTRMAYEKGLHLYFELANSNKEHEWILAGYPQCDIETGVINYLGEVGERDKKYILRDCELFVSTPCWYEPIGLTYLEAKATGKPIITFRLGGIPQYHEGIGSSLVDFCELGRMSDIVDYLHEDENERIRLGKEGRKQIEERNNENVVIRDHIRIYENILGKRR